MFDPILRPMTFPNLFDPEVNNTLKQRINSLTHETQPKWGKMNVANMLGHCNVTYEMLYETKHKKPGGFMKLMLKLFVKQAVVGPKPYPKNSRTAPAFLIADQREFETEKNRLLSYMQRVQNEGSGAFEGRESHSFGPLSLDQWNSMMYKHLDHHLKQFGV